MGFAGNIKAPCKEGRAHEYLYKGLSLIKIIMKWLNLTLKPLQICRLIVA